MFGAAIASRLPLALGAATPVYPFEEVPSSKSGITWVHRSGASAEKYLPETMGAGCAFFDYDNDGWMDIYLVNSGPCDFYDPGQATAQRALPQQPRRHFHRRDRESRSRRRRATARALPSATTTATDSPISTLPAIGAQHPVSQQRRRHLHRCHRESRRVRARLDHQRRVVRLRQRRPPRSVRLPLRRFRQSQAPSLHDSRRQTRRASALLHPEDLTSSHTSWLFHNNGDGTFTDVSQTTGIAEHRGKAPGRGRHRHQQRRPDGSVCHQRHRAQIFSSSIAATASSRRSASPAGVAYSADGRPRSGMGVDSADYDQRWLDGPLRHQHRPRNVFALSQQYATRLSTTTLHHNGIGRATQLHERLGPQVLRLRQRRQRGSCSSPTAIPTIMVEARSNRVSHREPLLLFHNDGQRIQERQRPGGPAFAPHGAARPGAGRLRQRRRRGCADLTTTTSPVAAATTRWPRNHWLGVRLVGKKANIDAIGARVT